MDAKEIKIIREKLGLTQKELGIKIGATGTSVYKWEHNRSKPHPVFVAKIVELAKEIK
jgi:DNA-binding transcriptional regulator YiaG